MSNVTRRCVVGTALVGDEELLRDDVALPVTRDRERHTSPADRQRRRGDAAPVDDPHVPGGQSEGVRPTHVDVVRLREHARLEGGLVVLRAVRAVGVLAGLGLLGRQEEVALRSPFELNGDFARSTHSAVNGWISVCSPVSSPFVVKWSQSQTQ